MMGVLEIIVGFLEIFYWSLEDIWSCGYSIFVLEIFDGSPGDI